MKKFYVYLLMVVLLNLLPVHQLQAGCGPAWMKKTVPAAGSFLLPDNKISFTFVAGSGTQQVVGGNIRLYKASNDSLIETIAIASVYPVGSYGNVDGSFEFAISKKLESETQYYVLIDSGSFACREYVYDFLKDSTGKSFVWNFTTASSPVTINYSGAVNFCQGETATLSVLKCYSYLWSTGETTQTITVHHSGKYSVSVVYMNGTSATNSIDISGKQPVSVPICYVSVDSLSQNNIITWDKANLSIVDSFIVYRETTTDNYQQVGAVPYKGSAGMFIDTVRTKYFPNTGNPNAGTYRYKLQVRDTCGNYSALSGYHNTIYMHNNNGTFSWIKLYNIEGASNPVNAYVLMRDDNSDGAWHAINSVSGTQFTVTDPAYLNFKNTARWRVETLWGISCGEPMKVKGSTTTSRVSRSNTRSALNSGIPTVTASDLFKLYPNPSQGKFILEMTDLQPANVKIYSILGELVYEQKTIGRIQSIDLSDYPANIYFVEVQFKEKAYKQKLVLTE